jgi:8-oxo-dGTP diphosphatase
VIPANAFYAGLHKVIPASGGFITDPDGKVLLVKPNYRDHWGWPGGHVDEGERPEEGCAREIREELGLTLPVGRLLVTHWVSPFDDRPYPLIHFLFDCGTIADGSGILLQAEELDGYGFFTADEAVTLMPSFLVARLQAAQDARKSGATTYLS